MHWYTWQQAGQQSRNLFIKLRGSIYWHISTGYQSICPTPTETSGMMICSRVNGHLIISVQCIEYATKYRHLEFMLPKCKSLEIYEVKWLDLKQSFEFLFLLESISSVFGLRFNSLNIQYLNWIFYENFCMIFEENSGKWFNRSKQLCNNTAKSHS